MIESQSIELTLDNIQSGWHQKRTGMSSPSSVLGTVNRLGTIGALGLGALGTPTSMYRYTVYLQNLAFMACF